MHPDNLIKFYFQKEGFEVSILSPWGPKISLNYTHDLLPQNSSFTILCILSKKQMGLLVSF